MSRTTAGTEIFFVDPDTNDLIEVECVTDFTISMPAKTQLQSTCLSNKRTHTYLAGLGTPSAPSTTVWYDPDSPSHRRLRALQDAGTILRFAVGYSNGDAIPDVDPDTGEFDFTSAVADRSFDEYEGFISNFEITGSVDSLYTASISIQQSGSVIPHHKTL